MPHIEEIRAEAFRHDCFLIANGLRERSFTIRVLLSTTRRYIIEASHETKHLIVIVRSFEKGPPHQVVHVFTPTFVAIDPAKFSDTLDAL